MTVVSMDRLCAAYAVMVDAMFSLENSSYEYEKAAQRAQLMKYLDGCALPIHFGHSGLWEGLTENAAKKLDALCGPYGYVLARAFLAKQKDP